MTVKIRKKNSRQRGSHTHGWGSKKKHRGSGNRGGKGMAGTGKRSDHRKPSIWKERYFGKRGFIKKGAKHLEAINIATIDENLGKWKDLIQQNGDVFQIDLKKLGYDKLLGTGKATRKYEISVEVASANAIKKIEESGGKVILKSEAK